MAPSQCLVLNCLPLVCVDKIFHTHQTYVLIIIILKINFATEDWQHKDTPKPVTRVDASQTGNGTSNVSADINCIHGILDSREATTLDSVRTPFSESNTGDETQPKSVF